jgi:hypothetical protein
MIYGIRIGKFLVFPAGTKRIIDETNYQRPGNLAPTWSDLGAWDRRLHSQKPLPIAAANYLWCDSIFGLSKQPTPFMVAGVCSIPSGNERPTIV